MAENNQISNSHSKIKAQMISKCEYLKKLFKKLQKRFNDTLMISNMISMNNKLLIYCFSSKI